jgi:hypothetical protein
MSSANRPAALPSSFRDPSGFVYEEDGILYRHVVASYGAAYERLMASGLYSELTAEGLLIPHEEIAIDPVSGARTLRPERLPFIAHPYEWCFGQGKDAALATLTIMRRALEKGMVLKDASAFNIAFRAGRPLLFDTLSFDLYQEGQSWIAYRQFCEMFLAPLAVMAHTDVRLGGLLRVHLDGIPLDMASRLLPYKTRLHPGLAMHLHLHAKAQQRGGPSSASSNTNASGGMSKTALLGLIENLSSTVSALQWNPGGSVWADYYDDTNYTASASDQKARIVAQMLKAIPSPNLAWDLGANDGRFSRLAAERGAFTVAWDFDLSAVENGWRSVKARQDENLLPLFQDLTNPSPDTGWELTERTSLLARGPADVTLALALVHHLAIGKNVPLPRVARFFAATGRNLIVEFVPKSDSQVQRMLAYREDIFPNYTEEAFAAALRDEFTIEESVPIPETQRTLYRCRRRQ